MNLAQVIVSKQAVYFFQCKKQKKNRQVTSFFLSVTVISSYLG